MSVSGPSSGLGSPKSPRPRPASAARKSELPTLEKLYAEEAAATPHLTGTPAETGEGAPAAAPQADGSDNSDQEKDCASPPKIAKAYIEAGVAADLTDAGALHESRTRARPVHVALAIERPASRAQTSSRRSKARLGRHPRRRNGGRRRRAKAARVARRAARRRARRRRRRATPQASTRASRRLAVARAR